MASLHRSRRLVLATSILPNVFRLLRIPFQALALPTSLSSPSSSSSSSPFFVSHFNNEYASTSPTWKSMAHGDEPETKPGTPAYWLKLAVVLCLVLIGGVLAGLTLGYMSQDSVNLAVLEATGDEKEKARAGKVLGLLKKGQHWVLVTLLLYNTITNETLPIFLDSILGGGVLAVASSTALILLFGEVIPQAICSRYGLAIGAASTPIMKVLMYASFPISYPIAQLLDKVLGHDEGTTYKRSGLKTFVSLHRHLGAENLLDDEVTIISAVLELSEKSVKDIMTPIADIYSLSNNQILDEETVSEILRQGYSRVPVYSGKDKSNYIGMLLVKNLVVYDPEDAKPVSAFNLIPLPEAEPSLSCLEALNFFQQGRSHMMLVTEYPGETKGALGIVSLEDVIEELIGEEIIDETDLFLDVANKIKVVRRPQIRTGAAKKLTPLLKDATARRKNTRQNSHAGSEADSTEGQNSANYGTISSPHIGGASTPKRRPSGPHRLGSVTSTALAFDKVKMKGVKGAQRSEAMQAVIQNLEAMGNTVEIIDPQDGSNGGPANGNSNGNGNSHEGGRDHPNTEEGDPNSHINVTVEHPNGHSEEVMVSVDEDENAPLLGGKQLASSPHGM